MGRLDISTGFVFMIFGGVLLLSILGLFLLALLHARISTKVIRDALTIKELTKQYLLILFLTFCIYAMFDSFFSTIEIYDSYFFMIQLLIFMMAFSFQVFLTSITIKDVDNKSIGYQLSFYISGIAWTIIIVSGSFIYFIAQV